MLEKAAWVAVVGWTLSGAAPGKLASGIDLAGIDHTVAPGDDFFGYANGAWLKATPIPADHSSWGIDGVLAEEARTRTVEMIREAADGGTDADGRRVGDCYASFLNEAAVEAKGITPLKPKLAAIAAIADRTALARALGAQLRADVDPLNASVLATPHLFGLFVAQGLVDPRHNLPWLLQGGLGMPDREYYLADAPRMVELRAKYLSHVAAILKLAGVADPAGNAKRIVALETKLATVHATRAESEDVHAAQLWKREELPVRAPGLDWAQFLEAAGLADQPVFTLWQPKAVTGLSTLVASEPLEAWKAWLTWHAIDDLADYLPRAFVDEHFAFYGKALSGIPELRERWKRGVDFTSEALGEAIGRLYVQRYFPPASKAKAEAMVKDLVKAFSHRIDALAWMSAKTKARAQQKLATLTVGVGYPDRWIDYSTLKLEPDDLFGNVERIQAFDLHRALAKLGKAPDRSEWWISPQVVNALNLPLQNALNFPAAILQPPYFDPAADPVLNYSAMGATIGHEISHAFDDLGSEFDAEGKLDNWWTPEDLAHFKASAERLAAQYDNYRPFPDLELNGHQTLGENIADVAGLAAAWDAWQLSLKGKPAPVRDGLSGEQRFFLSFAQSWRTKEREETLRAQVISDGHAPAEFRADTVRNLDAWYAAFAVRPAQRLFLKPAERVRVW